MSSIVISGDTSGAITLAAPAVAGTNTITLPAATGTVLTTGSPQSGGVIQVVSTNLTSYASTTNSTMTSSGLAVTITPKFSTSKILISAALSGSQSASNGSGYFTIYRNSTDLGTSNGLNVLYTNASFSNPFRIPVNMQYLDSPATTSSTTYTIYFKTNTVGTVALNQDSTASSITVMEIAA